MKCYLFFLLCFMLLDFGKCAQLSDCMTRITTFPSDFQLGVSTYSHQMDDAWVANGTNVEEWVTEDPDFEETTPTLCAFCDIYTILDFAEVDFYKFTISWSKAMPTGYASTINVKYLAHYSNVINTLLSENIEPHILIYDHDLPQALEERGGWANSEIVNLFVDYATVLFDRFARKVKYWYTIHDPQLCFEGYGVGSVVASKAERFNLAVRCAKNMMVAHGRVYKLYEQRYRKKNIKSFVGYAVTLRPGKEILSGLGKQHLREDPGHKISHAFTFMFTDPVYSKKGGWSEEVKTTFAKGGIKLPDFTAEETKMLKNASDILVLNVEKVRKPDTHNFGQSPLTHKKFQRLTNGTFGSFSTDIFQMYDSLQQLHLTYSHLPMSILVEIGRPVVNETIDTVNNDHWVRAYTRAICIAKSNGVNIVGMTIHSFVRGICYNKGNVVKPNILFQTDIFEPKRNEIPIVAVVKYLHVIEKKRYPFNKEEYSEIIMANTEDPEHHDSGITLLDWGQCSVSFTGIPNGQELAMTNRI